MTRKINIRPTTSVYATYKNISYRPWSAIGEFVDNSTQSYYDNKAKLIQTKYWDKLKIEISYINNDSEYGECLVIKDNAYGMNYHDFQRAIVLDSPPAKATRSEFGMGLKTAACWFGKKWSVETVELGSGIRYKTTVDVEQLKKYKNEEIEVEESECNEKEHGTIITIWDLNRQIKGRTIGKTKAQLTGIYRTDLRTGEISIIYNDEDLKYEEPAILTEVNKNGNTIVWRKELNFVIKHNGEDYPVKGFAAIREKGNTTEAGFTLMKNGRAIVGGFENNYRPEEVFGKSNSYVYQRLFGELSLDCWPVTQTKDQFDWYGGLEDSLIQELKRRLEDFINKANEYRKKPLPDVESSLENAVQQLADAKIIDVHDIKKIDNQDSSDEVGTDLNEELEGTDKEESAKTQYHLSISYKDSDYTVYLTAKLQDDSDNWLEITHDSNNKEIYKVVWNLGHPFFVNYIEDDNFIQTMGGFILALALCEIDGYSVSTNGIVDVSFIRTKMNNMLRVIMGRKQDD